MSKALITVIIISMCIIRPWIVGLFGGCFIKKIVDGTLDLAQEQEVQRNPLPQHNRGKATATVLIHIRNNEEDVRNNGELPPTAVSALQRSPAFRALFN